MWCRYTAAVMNLLRSGLFKEMPPHVRAHLEHAAYHWGQWILLLSPQDRAQLQHEYLPFWRHFWEQFAAGWRGAAQVGCPPPNAHPKLLECKKRGLYILMSPHAQGAGVAQHLAATLGTRVHEGKDAKNLTHLASAGAVVFVLASDGQALRLVREVQQMPLKSLPVAMCLLDVSACGAARSLAHQGLEGMAAPTKKLMGMTSSLRDKLGALERTSAARGWALEVCEIDWSSPSSRGVDHDLDVFLGTNASDASDSPSHGAHGGAVAACEEMRRAMSRAEERVEHAEQDDGDSTSETRVSEMQRGGLRDAGGAPIHVLMFVTMVGWGKNVLCDALAQMSASSSSSVAAGLRLEEELGLTAGAQVVILEGDALGKGFWRAVSQHVRQHHVQVLILNRNFPPNSWEPSRRKVMDAAEGIRRVNFVALVPAPAEVAGAHASGQHLGLQQAAARHPFALAELAVCMHGVLQRRGHSTKLDGEQCPEASKVVSSFYGYYSDVDGGHGALLSCIRNALAPQIIQLEWLNAGAVAAFQGSDELQELRQQVAAVARAQYARLFSPADEAALRHSYGYCPASVFPSMCTWQEALPGRPHRRKEKAACMSFS